MTDLERLTALLDNAPADPAGNRNVRTLAEYLLANGVIVPPCKVGDTVYYPVKGTNVMYTTKVYGTGLDEDGDVVINPKEYPKGAITIIGGNFGKTVFLTREEAERALKGGEHE